LRRVKIGQKWYDFMFGCLGIFILFILAAGIDRIEVKNIIKTAENITDLIDRGYKFWLKQRQNTGLIRSQY
jgi:hypothetical protein